MPKVFSSTPAVTPPAGASEHDAGGGAASSVPARRKIRVRAGSAPKPRRRRSVEPPVVLTYLPDRVVVIGDRVIPNLVSQPLQPGAGGVRLLRDGSWDFSGLRDDDEQRGGVFLDPARVGYIEEADDGTLYNTWESPAEFAELVAGLVADGTVPALTVDEVLAFVEGQQQIADAIRSGQRNPEAYVPEIERQIAVARRWLAEKEAA